MKMSRLKNGTDESTALVATIMAALRSAVDEAPMAVYELVEVCRNQHHKPFGNAGDLLNRFKLMHPDGRVHGSIRNIVLSAAEGEGMDMTFGNPVKEKTVSTDTMATDQP